MPDVYHKMLSRSTPVKLKGKKRSKTEERGISSWDTVLVGALVDTTRNSEAGMSRGEVGDRVVFSSTLEGGMTSCLANAWAPTIKSDNANYKHH